MHIHINVCKQMNDVELLILHSNTWNKNGLRLVLKWYLENVLFSSLITCQPVFFLRILITHYCIPYCPISRLLPPLHVFSSIPIRIGPLTHRDSPACFRSILETGKQSALNIIEGEWRETKRGLFYVFLGFFLHSPITLFVQILYTPSHLIGF